jgi:hypothetical protein
MGIARAGIALVALVMGASSVMRGNSVLHASSSPPTLALDVHLTSTQTLPAASMAALVAEATAIWGEGHVQLRWNTTQANARVEPAADSAFLRVVIMAHLVPARTNRSPWSVGELVRSEGSNPLAIASITGARRVLEECGESLMPEQPFARDRRVGIVLGRAIAHEIGHFLLATDTHARKGLMRASIAVHEFADVLSRGFRLDDAAQDHLARIAAGRTFPVEPAKRAFSYSR